MTTVPNAAGAVVAPAKIQAFLLNESHSGNRGRAKFFSRFGFDLARWAALRDALLAHVATNQVVETETTNHGTNYMVRCSMLSPDGRNPSIFKVWAIEPDGVRNS
jgi:hypothetical protein